MCYDYAAVLSVVFYITQQLCLNGWISYKLQYSCKLVLVLFHVTTCSLKYGNVHTGLPYHNSKSEVLDSEVWVWSQSSPAVIVVDGLALVWIFLLADWFSSASYHFSHLSCYLRCAVGLSIQNINTTSGLSYKFTFLLDYE